MFLLTVRACLFGIIITAMDDKVAQLYQSCSLCPNLCGVNRIAGEIGFCGQTAEVKVAWSGLHRGEEPPISGTNGSGMIFFCGCSLQCAYCQNYQISGRNNIGTVLSIEQLSEIMVELQKFGAETLNLVTGTHYIPSIISALDIAKQRGLTIPVVWNSGGYETVDALRLIDSYIDLYLLDVKTLDKNVASQFCGLERYADTIGPVMKFLKKRRSHTCLTDKLDGVLIRHLVFPNCIDATMQFLTWYADNFKENFNLSLMTQFVPPKNDVKFPSITDSQYKRIVEVLDVLGIDGFIQEPSKDEILWIPDFTKEQPFPEGFADPLPYFIKLKKGL